MTRSKFSMDVWGAPACTQQREDGEDLPLIWLYGIGWRQLGGRTGRVGRSASGATRLRWTKGSKAAAGSRSSVAQGAAATHEGRPCKAEGGEAMEVEPGWAG